LSLPATLDNQNIEYFAQTISSLIICEGCAGFDDIINSRLNLRDGLLDDNGKSIYNFETEHHYRLNISDIKILKHKYCEIFSTRNNKVCSVCSKSKDSLRTIRARLNKSSLDPLSSTRRTSGDSSTNYRYLDREEIIERLINVQKQKHEALSKGSKLGQKLQKLLQKQGAFLEKEQSEELGKNLDAEKCSFDPESPQWLLWQQQKEQFKKSDPRQMRWHPLIIRWCLSIYHTSPAPYRQISSKKLQFLKLPHINTLKKYTNFTTPKTGFNIDILQQLITDAKLETASEFERNITICFDEMQIKSDLVYRKSTGQLIGFTELGEVNDEIRQFEENLNSENLRTDFATHVLVYMARGIFSRLCYPFAYYASCGFSSSQLFSCTLNAVSALERLSFIVRVSIADGATPNRKFFKIVTNNEID